MPLDAKPDTRLECRPTPRDGRADLPCGREPAAWCVAATHPQAERWADANLRRIGYNTYLPLLAVRRRDRHTPTVRHTVLVPLFPGYLFVLLDARPWTPVRYAQGIRAMLMADGRPQTCPSGAVEALLAAEDARRTPMTHGNAIAPGDAVTVIAGALGGHLGCIASIDDDTASVSIMLLGRLTNVRMPLDQIVPAGEMERWP